MRLWPCLCLLLGLFLNGQAAGACQPAQSLPAEKSLLGLQLFYAEDQRSWQLADDLGIRWVRLELQWRLLEPAAGHYDWDIADRILEPAIRRKLGILALLNHPPDWVKPAELPAAFARFASVVLDRYGSDRRADGVRTWEIFNEPNLSGYGWPSEGLDPATNAKLFAAVLAAVNQAIRNRHPQAVLVSGGLSPDGQDPEAFLRALYASGVAQCFDVLGLHPYGREGQLIKTLHNAQVFLATMHDAAKPVWFTEYGTDSNADRARLIDATFAEAPALTALFWFNERDIHRYTDRYGLVDYDYQRKPETALFQQRLAAQHRAGAKE